MDQEPIARRDAVMYAAVAMLSPLIATVPRRTAGLGGAGGWLGVLLGALPLAVCIPALAWAARRIGKTGLAALYRCAFGGRFSGALGLLYALWLFGMMVTCVQAGSERLIQSVYPQMRDVVFGGVLLLLVWRAGWNTPAANGRMGRICFFLLGTVMAVVLLLAARRVRVGNLAPVWWQDLGGIGLAALPCAGLFAIPAAALWADRPALGRVRLRGWCLGYALVLAIMGGVCTGVFGPGLTARLDVPFFSLAKECTALSRLESVVTGVWVLSDVLFALMLLRGIQGALGESLPRIPTSGRWSSLFILAPALAAACAIPSNYVIKEVLTPIWMAGSAVLGYALPMLACLTLRIRDGKEAASGISSGGNG